MCRALARLIASGSKADRTKIMVTKSMVAGGTHDVKLSLVMSALKAITLPHWKRGCSRNSWIADSAKSQAYTIASAFVSRSG